MGIDARNDEARAAWLEERRKGIGASDVGSILELPGAYATPFDIWAGKVHGIGQKASGAMTVGHYLEDGVLNWYEDTMEVGLERQIVAVDADDPRIRATLDAVTIGTSDPWGVEAKVTKRMGENGWTHDSPPVIVIAQVQWQMRARPGLAFIDVVVLFTDTRTFFTYRIYPDEEVQLVLVQRCIAWWELYVEGGAQPAMAGRKPIPFLNTVHEFDPDMEIDGGQSDALAAIRDVHERYKAVKAEKEEADLSVRAFMKGARRLLHGLGRVSLSKPFTTRRVDAQKLRAQFPEVYDKVVYETEEQRKLTYTWSDE